MTDSNRVQIFVNILGDRVDGGVEFILDFEHVMLIILSNEIDRNTKMTKPTRTPYPMQVGVRRPREVEIDDHIDRQNVDTSREEIRADETPSLSVAEVMVNPALAY